MNIKTTPKILKKPRTLFATGKLPGGLTAKGTKAGRQVHELNIFRNPNNFHFTVFLLIFPIFFSCHTQTGKVKEEGSDLAFSQSNPSIATGFKIQEYVDYSILSIYHPWDSTVPPQLFYLVSETNNTPLLKNKSVIRVPVKSIVCLSASHISFLDALGQIDKLTGVNNADYVVSKEFQNLVESGKIKEIGIGDHYKLENLIALSPDIVMVSPQPGQSFEPLLNAGLIVLPNGDYLESHPLGRAEWIKCMGALFGCEKKAIALFDSIKNEYNTLKNLTATIQNKPTVLSGNQYGGFWNLPGGLSYEARFLADAGAEFFFANNSIRGSYTLDFETVYAKGYDADFWRILIYDKDKYSYEKLIKEDPRYQDFKAFINRNVFICNTFSTPYFQKGLLEPHIILADYINIFHPGLLKGHQNVYYRMLK